MNAAQKSLIALAFAAATVSGLRAWVLQRRVESMRRDQAAFVEQVRELLQEHDEMDRKLSILRGENEHLAQNSSELQKLRGEIAQLRKSEAQREIHVEGASAPPPPSATPEEPDLNERQRIALKDLTEKVRTGNSIDDIDRLNDSLKRWDELFVEPAPEEMKLVFKLLKVRLIERIADLREQKKRKEGITAPQEK